MPPGPAWSITGSTGTMAASLAQDSLVFAIGALAADATRPNILPPGPLQIQAIRMVYTVLFNGVITAGQALRFYKANNAAQAMPTGGTALTPRPKRTKDQSANTGLIGDIARISTTAGLTAGTFTRDTVPLATFDLAAGFTAKDRLVFEFDEHNNGSSMWLDPGEILVVSNPAAFQTAMTWQLTVNVDYRVRDTL